VVPVARETTTVLKEAVNRVYDAKSLDEALLGLVGLLSDDFGLWTARVFAFTDDSLVVVAKWSGAETVLDPGTEISLSLTATMRQASESVRAGRLVTHRSSQIDLGLISEIHREEGVASWLVMPLRPPGGEVVAALSFNSSSPTAFSDEDLPFFKALAESTQARLVQLLRRQAP
jgi:GAF domain-containing protein